MTIDIDKSFQGLPMGDLIGGPLMAAADDQVRLANATAQFIQQIGSTPPSASPVGERSVTFRIERPVSGDASIETVTLDVPLLAIVKLPSPGIGDVAITIDPGGADDRVCWGPFSLRLNVDAPPEGAIAPGDQSATYDVAVRLADDGMPEGLARVLDMMNRAPPPPA